MGALGARPRTSFTKASKDGGEFIVRHSPGRLDKDPAVVEHSSVRLGGDAMIKTCTLLLKE